MLKNIAVRSKPHLFTEPQELGIGVISVKKAEEKAMNREAVGRLSALGRQCGGPTGAQSWRQEGWGKPTGPS